MEIKPPLISESTQKEMAKFFMRTSIPRIIAAQKEKEAEQNELSGKIPSKSENS